MQGNILPVCRIELSLIRFFNYSLFRKVFIKYIHITLLKNYNNECMVNNLDFAVCNH